MKSSIFNDVIGPVMRGSSSSHTAAAEHGLDIQFLVAVFDASHPITYRIRIENDRDEKFQFVAILTGGGMIEMISLNGSAISIKGDFFETRICFESQSPNSIQTLLHNLRNQSGYSEVIISSTNSTNPVFPDINELFTGKTFVGIGSYKPDCREFPEQLFRHLDQLFVVTLDGKKESGDLITPVQKNWISEDKIHTLSSSLSGDVVPATNTTRLFKTVGSAVFDLFAAKLVYEKNIKLVN